MKVSVIGATGYTGYELVKILANHPEFEIAALVSETYADKMFSDVYPRLRSICDVVITGRDYDAVAEISDAVFLCLPHAAAQDAAAFFYEKGLKVVDFSADFRLKDKKLYEATYKVDHTYPDLLRKAVYGLPEIFEVDIKKAELVANPGCYPTSVITPLYPLLKAGLISPEGIIADSKVGVTVAGRKADIAYSFCECNEDFRPYAIFSHRHNPEINEVLKETGKETNVLFTPHIIPASKGIESTIYTKTTAGLAEISACLKDFYRERRCVRIYDNGHIPSTADVTDTNFIDIGLFVKGERLIIVSCIDNLIKGSSGMAVQNMNLMCGFDDTLGILLEHHHHHH
uniref:N-acetyl-gamma-glutamyl-phosphate reductase n=1 Tax=Denitrovibrio acetiphilus (strain DSM 12809 / NBRC 114555 / N2460) TaxID=522772 RepID=UPI00240E9B68|nr:Chain A, N-acetyl-gamma-glutamyl-phosphate reductase [Denitrovibrio acetiphilus DSM 12809]8AFV_B Chain B, N-acetyl-gamma-glutamyl-phosphate reductase [Denitrovibrio acetiphilus DSM 12809]8AFV_C Chain C, N-acetyl-gamma-glutamyl-phosphate reductase [Denitrovibrio acetiphilus DSM 12809]8AFV_D Chain D, N-acetyl-gamma-glutamyl-phosphate reductase [Denitrovibrio acetiphilus DSM 12809]